MEKAVWCQGARPGQGECRYRSISSKMKRIKRVIGTVIGKSGWACL